MFESNTCATSFEKVTGRRKEVEKKLTSLAGSPSVARSAHAGSVFRRAGASVLARAGHGAVRPPEALRADAVTVDAC